MRIPTHHVVDLAKHNHSDQIAMVISYNNHGYILYTLRYTVSRDDFVTFGFILAKRIKKSYRSEKMLNEQNHVKFHKKKRATK